MILMPVRMKDIARDLGVSAVTVSKVLRDHPDIGKATKERVLQRVKELQYRPNLLARGLVTGRSLLVALVVPNLVHSFFAEIAVSLSESLRKHGYTMFISWTDENPLLQANEIEHLLSIGVDALVIATAGEDLTSFHMLDQRGVPYVLLDRDLPLKAPFVGVDDLVVGEMATAHLIESGCKRIAHIVGPETTPGRLRLQGYKKALEKAGLPVRDQYIVAPTADGPRTFSHGFGATQKLLALRPKIDGIFCFNDPFAVGATEAVIEAGLRMPADIAIIGCGNLPLGEALRRPLSTIDQDTSGLGEKVAKVLLSRLASDPKPLSTRRWLIKPKLIARGTSGKQPRI
jgi:LacI family transcriptional regulator